MMLPTRACAPRPATTVLEHGSQRLLTPGTDYPVVTAPPKKQLERRDRLLWESEAEPTGPCLPVRQCKDLA